MIASSEEHIFAAKPVVAALSEEKLALKLTATLQEYCASNSPKR